MDVFLSFLGNASYLAGASPPRYVRRSPDTDCAPPNTISSLTMYLFGGRIFLLDIAERSKSMGVYRQPNIDVLSTPIWVPDFEFAKRTHVNGEEERYAVITVGLKKNREQIGVYEQLSDSWIHTYAPAIFQSYMPVHTESIQLPATNAPTFVTKVFRIRQTMTQTYVSECPLVPPQYVYQTSSEAMNEAAKHHSHAVTQTQRLLEQTI